MSRERVFLDGRFWPDELEKLVLIENTLTMFDQGNQDFEGFGSERDERLVAPEQAAAPIDNVRSESIPAPGGLRAVWGHVCRSPWPVRVRSR